jgi:hypothetical protein
MNKIVIIIFFVFVSSLVVKSQVVSQHIHEQAEMQGNHSCATKTRPLSDSIVKLINKGVESKATRYTVSVVIHDYTNTSDLAIAQMIAEVNSNFALAVAGGGGDETDIRFCIAKTTPAGNPTSGILHSTGNSSNNFFGYTIGQTPGTIAIWDPERYLNIYIVNSIPGSVNGVATLPWNYATNPNQPALSNPNAPYNDQLTATQLTTNPAFAALGNKDGVIIEAGSINTGNNYVMTHEAGHYLGLPHPFSDSSPTSCVDGDGLNCTGNSLRNSPSNCSPPSGCSGMDRNNFMVYSACTPYRYRVCQKDVMRYVLNNQRSGIKNNGKCDAAYDLSIDNATITKNNCNLTFDASIVISRNGSQNLTNAILRYRINGGAFVSIPWPGNLTNSNPTRTINLTGLTGVNGGNTFYVELRNVNNNLNGNQKDQEISNDAQTKTFNMNQPSAVSVSASNTTICAGESVSLTASGSSSYSWNQSLGNGANKTASPNTTKNYIVTGTTSGCTTTDNVQVTVNAKPNASIGSVVQETCQNQNGSFTVNPSGGQSPYQYSLNNGAYVSGANITNVGAGTNTIRVRDANGCISSAVSTTITNTGGFATSITTDTDICIGESTTVTVTAPSSGITYTWNNSLSGITQHTVSPTATTTYNVTITDGTCTKNESSTVTVNQLPSVSANANSISICTGDNLTLTGSGASTYVWDNNVSDGVSFVPSSTTTYSVTGTDANGCVKASNVTVTVNSLPTVVANASSNSICIGDNLTLSGGGASTYVWDNSVTDGSSFSPTSTTTYSVTGTDGNGCVNTATTNVVVNQLPTVVASTTNDSVCVGSSVTLSGSGASTYSWNNSVLDGVPFSPTSNSSYTVTGTDVNGCVNQDVISLTSLPSPTVNMSLSEVTLCKDESVSVSASGATSYSWITNDLTQNVTLNYPESFDSLSVYGIDAMGRCSTYYAIPFNQSNMETTITPGFSLCIGDQAPVSVSNLGGVGLQYAWNNGLSNTNSHLISPTSPTTYEVVVTDVYGCNDTLSTNIDVIASPNLSLSTNSIVFCSGDEENIIASGADEYVWDTGDSLSTLHLEFPLGIDSIVVTGINQGLCYDTEVISITESFMSNSISDSTAICLEDTVELAVQTNDPSLSYSWDNNLPSISSHSLSPTTTTTYNVIVTDALGCKDTLVTEVIVVPLPQLVLNLNEVILCEGAQEAVVVSGADDYSWNTGDTLDNLIVSYPTGLDSLKVIGINGGACMTSLSIPINQSSISASITGGQRICEGGNVSLLIASSNTTLDYNWNEGLSNSNFHSVSPSITTIYEVELVDEFGCKDTLTTTVEVDTVPSLTVEPTSLLLCLGEQATLTASGANEYSWSSGGAIATETITASTNTTINLVGVNGACSQSLSIPVQVEPVPVTVISSNTTSINTGESIQFYNAGSSASNYEWNFGDGSTNSTFANPYHSFDFPGAYIIQLTGFQGECLSVDSLLVYVGTVGILDNENEAIVIYPNPTEGIVNFSIENESSQYEVIIYNNIGSIVYKEESITAFNNKIDLTFLSDGVYYLKALSSKNSKVFQIQIIH